MAYIGNTPLSVAFLTDTFSGNGSTVAFTMTVAPANTSSILVAITGVVQDPSTYSVSGTTLTFSAAPPSGTSNISVRYLGIPASGVTTTAYRTVTDFTATAGQTTFSVPSYTVGYIDVYRNGVRLGSADYTATSGTTVVLANACTVGDLVVTESFYVSSVLNAIPATAGSVGTTYLADASVTAAKLASGAARSNFGAGAVLQVVQGTASSYSSNSTTTFAASTLAATITPSSASNKILCFVSSNVWYGGLLYMFSTLYRNGTNVAASLANQSLAENAPVQVSGYANQFNFVYLDSPASTSALTYTLYFKSGTAGTPVYVVDTQSASTITLMEIAG